MCEKEQKWFGVSIFMTPEAIEPVFGLCMEMGFGGAEIVDEGDFFNFLENYPERWDYVDDEVLESRKCPTHIKVYLRNDENARERLAELGERLSWLKKQDIGVPLGSLSVSLEDIDESDWFDEWKKHFKAFGVGDRVMVTPEWEPVPDTDRITLKINPGMMFGTGSHSTTKMCMEILEGTVTEGMSVFDIGCGSGILSVLSLLLGAGRVLAVDIDNAAEKIVLKNARANEIGGDKLLVFAGNILEGDFAARFLGEQFDLVLANIVADVVIPLSSVVSRYLKKDGLFLCSGIIDSRAEETKQALAENGFKIIKQAKEGEWHAYLAAPERV